MIKIIVVNIAVIEIKFCFHYQVTEIDVIAVDTCLASQCRSSVFSNEDDAVQAL